MAHDAHRDAIKITREEVLKLGHISNISITEDEIPALIDKLQAVLSYASYLKEIASEQQSAPMPKQVNVLREDQVIPTPSDPLLALAPEREDNFFVVPKILQN